MSGEGEGATVTGHAGLLEGISDAQQVRDLILAKWRASQSAGLGDETLVDISAVRAAVHATHGTTSATAAQPADQLAVSFSQAPAFTEHQIALLESIRDLARQLSNMRAEGGG
jgi:hypothetical protein